MCTIKHYSLVSRQQSCYSHEQNISQGRLITRNTFLESIIFVFNYTEYLYVGTSQGITSTFCLKLNVLTKESCSRIILTSRLMCRYLFGFRIPTMSTKTLLSHRFFIFFLFFRNTHLFYVSTYIMYMICFDEKYRKSKNETVHRNRTSPQTHGRITFTARTHAHVDPTINDNGGRRVERTLMSECPTEHTTTTPSPQ